MTAVFEESDNELRRLLAATKTIAVIGAKEDPTEDAHRVPLYMQRAGYRILPVNPKIDRVLGEPCQPQVDQVTEAVDLVNLFRASEHVAAHVDEIPYRSLRLRAGMRYAPDTRTRQVRISAMPGQDAVSAGAQESASGRGADDAGI